MKLASPEPFPPTESPTIKVAIIYEDFACGVRAKDFAERLAEQLGHACHLAESCWRSDLLECTPIATEAALVTANCDYLIVALRGDHVLPIATRNWIEAQLDDAAGRDMALIVLPDSVHGRQRVVEAIRHHFRTVCAMKGVAFFSHAMSPPLEVRNDGIPALSMRPWTPGWAAPDAENDRLHEFAHQH